MKWHIVHISIHLDLISQKIISTQISIATAAMIWYKTGNCPLHCLLHCQFHHTKWIHAHSRKQERRWHYSHDGGLISGNNLARRWPRNLIFSDLIEQLYIAMCLSCPISICGRKLVGSTFTNLWLYILWYHTLFDLLNCSQIVLLSNVMNTL